MSTNVKPSTGRRMNSTSLYVTTTQIILKANPDDPESWKDLYRIVPYLRNSLCCVVCSNLLVVPYTPRVSQCQHHICEACQGGKKKIKPPCENCKNCNDYVENVRLRLLLKCYKTMCIYVKSRPIFKVLSKLDSAVCVGYEKGASNLIKIFNEGAALKDTSESSGGLPKSIYSILPCIYGSGSGQNSAASKCTSPELPLTSSTTTNSSSFYSVLSPGNGSKITLKRKHKEEFNKRVFKKPSTIKPKKGCRCGNATATPGKLTCCGQRCPCYVANKPCVDCRCRGCRNPHIKEGQKIIPNLAQVPNIYYKITGLQKTGIQKIQVSQQNFNTEGLQKFQVQKQIIQIPQNTYITDIEDEKVSDVQKQKLNLQQLQKLRTIPSSTVTKPQMIPCNIENIEFDEIVRSSDMETVEFEELNVDSQFVNFSPLVSMKQNLPIESMGSFSPLPELIPLTYSEDDPEINVI